MSWFQKKNFNLKEKLPPVVNKGETCFTPLVELKQVVKIYQTISGGFTALKGISVDFCRGEFIGIMGKSGAGKTTLINMITGVDHLSSGEVLIGGHSIHHMGESSAARLRGQNMGIVYQSFRLMPTLSLLDNVMLPIDLSGDFNRRRSLERALFLLEEVELQDHIHKLPSAISGGQQQRVAIARALANDPPILVADEPTGRLDSVTAEIIYAIFDKLAAHGKLVIMATHDSSIYPIFSRRLQITDGELESDQIKAVL